MSFIKDNSKILIFALVAFIMVGGGLFYKLVLVSQFETLESIKYENQIRNDELQHLQDEYRMLGQKKAVLKDIDMQTKSLEEQVPTYETSVMLMSEVIQYTQIYNYRDRAVEVGTTLPKTDESQDYQTIPVTIRYTTSYEDSIKFLEMINRSYYMITIDSYSIDNSIQENNENEDLVKVAKDTVETELVLHMHYQETGEPAAYPNFMAYLEKEENIFERPLEDSELELNDMDLDADNSGGTGDEAGSKSNEQAKASTKTTFNIHLADILRSGDNYSFSGYSPNQDPVYVGLTSSKDTKIELIIRDNSYSCLIEDSEGNKNEKRIDARVENPNVNITSQIQNVMELMPTASIYIRNYTPGAINVNLRGTSLENVLIYNENNKLVEPGTQSGKIVVTR